MAHQHYRCSPVTLPVLRPRPQPGNSRIELYDAVVLERFPVKWKRHPIDKLNSVIPRESGEPSNHGRCGVLDPPLSRGMTPQELSERFNMTVIALV